MLFVCGPEPCYRDEEDLESLRQNWPEADKSQRDADTTGRVESGLDLFFVLYFDFTSLKCDGNTNYM